MSKQAKILLSGTLTEITRSQRAGRFLSLPADAYEILSLAAESKTTPLGASVGNGHSTAGSVGGNVDLMNGLSEEQKLREGQDFLLL